jgi:hypothetical protein
MKLRNVIKASALGSQLAMMSALWIGQPPGASAAEPAADAQAQARELLSRTSIGGSERASTGAYQFPASDPAQDAQAQARAMILGSPSAVERAAAMRSAAPITRLAARLDDARTEADAQTVARRMVLSGGQAPRPYQSRE